VPTITNGPGGADGGPAERFGVQVVQLLGAAVSQRAHQWMRKRETEVATTQMGRMGAEAPVGISVRGPG